MRQETVSISEAAISRHSILFVGDDSDELCALGTHFTKLGHDVYLAEAGDAAVSLHEGVHPHVTVLDFALRGTDGLEVLDSLRGREATVIVLTEKGEVETAVEAMRLGAENFLVKPIDLGHLSVAVERAAEKEILRQENVELKRRLHPGIKRRLVRATLLVLLTVVSSGVGMLIGGIGGGDRPRSPIPISVDSGG